MTDIGTKISTSTKQSSKKLAQAAALEARKQSLEVLKSAKSQVLPRVEQVSQYPASQDQPSLVQDLRQNGPQSLNPAEIHRREQEHLIRWRQLLSEIQNEQAQVHQQKQQEYQEIKSGQEESMQAGQAPPGERPLIIPQGKRKGGLRGMKAAIQQKMSRHETGHGAKN
jgi:hypothetical protein